MKQYFRAFYALLLAFAPAACAMHGQSATPTALPPYNPQNIVQPFDTHGGIATMDVAVGDAPPAFFGSALAGVNLAISEIDVVDASGNSLVVAKYTTPLIVNLLQFQDGSGDSVGTASVNNLQTYQQVRFVVDTAASTVLYTGGLSAPLNFVTNSDSSSSHAGALTSTSYLDAGHVAITQSGSFTIGSGASELVNADFNLMESLTPPSIGWGRGNGGSWNSSLGLTVRPTVFVAVSSNESMISGTVVNDEGRPVSNAVVVAVGRTGQVGNTVATDSSGNFLLHTLAAGTYRLDVYNQYTNSAGSNFSSRHSSSDTDRLRGPTITVSPGQTFNAGTITD
ncbi:MAG TPA: carboxypeptidase regulatory-like domain-containing protein [Candidatus Rubrimentiphilum sp.]|nr:carboxypeptidase regulatory-like domain-containing protein [Candidatus Rubrimentiphilum sp.]